MNTTPKLIILFAAMALGIILVVVGTVNSLTRLNLISFHNDVRAGDLISAVSFIGAAVGLFLNWWQLRLGGIRKRAEFIVSVFNQFITDSESSHAFYDIEYDRLHYDEELFHGSDEERRLDRLLSYFEKIAALYEIGTISLEDLKLVRYDLVRVYQNEDVQKYFKTLDKYTSAVKGGTFATYRRVAALLEAQGSARD